MFDKKIVVNIPQDIKTLELGEGSLLILQTKDNLTCEQYIRLKEQLDKSINLKVILLEGGISIETILTSKLPIKVKRRGIK